MPEHPADTFLVTIHDTQGDTKSAQRTYESGGNRPNGAHARGSVLSDRSARRFTSSTSQSSKVSELDGTRKPENEHRRKEFFDDLTAQKSLLNVVKASSGISTGHSSEARRVIHQSQRHRSRRVLRQDRDSKTDEQNTMETMENYLDQSTPLNGGTTEESTVPVSEKRFLKIGDDKDKRGVYELMEVIRRHRRQRANTIREESNSDSDTDGGVAVP